MIFFFNSNDNTSEIRTTIFSFIQRERKGNGSALESIKLFKCNGWGVMSVLINILDTRTHDIDRGLTKLCSSSKKYWSIKLRGM